MRTTWLPALSRSALAVLIAAFVGCVSNPTPHPGSSDAGGQLNSGEPPVHVDEGPEDPLMGGGSGANASAADAMGEPAVADADAGATDSEGGDTAGPADAAVGGD